MPADLDARIDALYCLPVDQFIAERDTLAREFKAAGQTADGAAVAKLAKPSVAAWAVNQVVRSRPKETKALWKAGDKVLRIQEQAVAGKAKGPKLREAIAAERAALEPLAEAARGLVTGRGAFLSEAAAQAVVETLHAAAVDPAARPAVQAGRLVRPLALSGLSAHER